MQCLCLWTKGVSMQVDPHGKTWNRLRASIGQPTFMEKPLVRHSNHVGVVTASTPQGNGKAVVTK